MASRVSLQCYGSKHRSDLGVALWLFLALCCRELKTHCTWDLCLDREESSCFHPNSFLVVYIMLIMISNYKYLNKTIPRWNGGGLATRWTSGGWRMCVHTAYYSRWRRWSKHICVQNPISCKLIMKYNEVMQQIVYNLKQK